MKGVKYCLKNYENWAKSTHEPSWGGNNGHGASSCLNLWPSTDYQWNDQQCASEFCFVCEYTVPVMTVRVKRITMNDWKLTHWKLDRQRTRRTVLPCQDCGVAVL